MELPESLRGLPVCPWCGRPPGEIKGASAVRCQVQVSVPYHSLVKLVEKMQHEGADPEDNVVIHLGDEEKEESSNG